MTSIYGNWLFSSMLRPYWLYAGSRYIWRSVFHWQESWELFSQYSQTFSQRGVSPLLTSNFIYMLMFYIKCMFSLSVLLLHWFFLFAQFFQVRYILERRYHLKFGSVYPCSYFLSVVWSLRIFQSINLK